MKAETAWWKQRYLRLEHATADVNERDRIVSAIGAVARRIAHIGSTSVPDLVAKPVIDIMVTVDDPDDDAAFVLALTKAGYVLRVIEPEHRMFRTPTRDVHVHLWRADTDEARRHLLSATGFATTQMIERHMRR